MENGSGVYALNPVLIQAHERESEFFQLNMSYNFIEKISITFKNCRTRV